MSGVSSAYKSKDLCALAQDVHASIETLAELAQAAIPEVRAAVAVNAKTPLTLLAKLAQDEDKFVRMAIAASPLTTIEILRELSLDANKEVAQKARATFSAVQEKLAESGKKIA